MKMKNAAAVILGLLIGAIVAIPAFWMGIKRGLNTMYSQAERDFGTVEERLQTMSDEALALRKTLSQLGWRGDPSPFLDVEEKRSWLHGSFPLPLKMELAEDLERSLLKVEEVWVQAARNREHIRLNPYYRGWGLQWETLKRYLVKEEKLFLLSAKEYSAGLNHWIFALFYNGKKVDLAALLGKYRITIEEQDAKGGYKTLAQGGTARKSFDLQADIEGMKQGTRDKDGKVIFLELPKPYWLAEAPIPEHDYNEIQYDRDTTIMSMTNIESQSNVAVDEKPVYENRHAPEKFQPEKDIRQKKVIY